MKLVLVRFSVALSALALSACGGTDEPADPGGTGGTGGGMCSDAIVATAQQNYAFTSTITLPPITVMPDTELTFEWGGVTKDLLNHDMHPMTDIDNVELGLWQLTQTELEMKLNADQLAQRDLAVIANIETNRAMTNATLFQFTSVGMVIPPEMILPYVNATNYPPAENTYTVMIATGVVLGQGTRLLQAFKLDPASTNTTVTLQNSSVNLVWDATLTNLTSPLVNPGNPNITIDWSNMTVNSMGYEFRPTDITEVLVGKYMETPAELQAQFLDLELIDEDIFRADVPSGTSFNLSMLRNEAGATFAGIDSNFTWALALICGDCANPAPWYLTILKPCSG